MKLAITGASGYIGERLSRLAAARGYEIVALMRRRPTLPTTAWQPYDLTSTTEIQLPPGLDAVVHLAATVSHADIDINAEVLAAQRLLAAATRSNCRFVFVSSQTARADAPTAYGQSKWRIERDVLAAGGIVIRPGLVYGACERALFGQLVATVRKLPLLPAFLPAPKVQPVHVDDLAAAILVAAENPALPSSVFCIGAPIAVSFTAFLSCIARHWLQRFRLVVPVPTILVSLLRPLAGRTGFLSFTLDRLTSLFALPAMASTEDLARLGITLRPLTTGMARSGNGARRMLLREGRAFLRYTLRDRPPLALLRRYVRALEQLQPGMPLALPAAFLLVPTLLPLLEGGYSEELRRRLQIAVAVGEASPQGAKRYLRLGRETGFARALLLISGALAAELLWRLLRLCLWPLLQHVRRRAELRL